MVKRPVVFEVPLVLDSFYLISFSQYLLSDRFPENDCSFDGLLTLLRESARHSVKDRFYFSVLGFSFSSVSALNVNKSQHLLLCHVMKMCHVCYYNNSDATFRLLMSGHINPNPGPVSASTAGKINCLVMNTRSLKSYHKAAQQTRNPCVTSFASRTWSDVICVNETWLNQNIRNSEISHSGFTIFRRDRSDRGSGGVLIAIKTAAFKDVKEFKPESEAELQQLEIIFAEITTLSGQRILFCFCYRPPSEDSSWMDAYTRLQKC